jgi:hypothetical protein
VAELLAAEARIEGGLIDLSRQRNTASVVVFELLRDVPDLSGGTGRNDMSSCPARRRATN